MKDDMNNPPSQALLTPSDIAKLGDVSAAAVSNWRKRAGDFPPPAGGTKTRPLYARDEVITWMRAHNKPIAALAESNALAVLNLLRSALPVGQAAFLVVSLCAARKLSDDAGSQVSLWRTFEQRAGDDGMSALRALGREAKIPDWDNLVSLPPYVDDIPARAVQLIAEALGQIPGAQLAATADAVLQRAVGALGRKGSDLGYIGNQVSEFLAAVSSNDAHGTVYDPACGIGDVLTRLAESNESRIERLIGHDINGTVINVARQRAFLRDLPVELRETNVLAEDADPDLVADLIVADVPYGLRYDGYDLLDPRWRFGSPTKNSSDLSWIQHAIAHLAEGGVAYVITPNGALFRGGQEGRTRQRLVESGCVHAIYQLPPKLLQHTSIAVAVWVLGQPGTSQSVKFVDSSTAEVSSGRSGFEASNPSADVSVADVLAGEANLAPKRWIGLDTPDPASVISTYREALTKAHNLRKSLVDASVREFRPTGGSRSLRIGELTAQGQLETRRGRMGSSSRAERDTREVSGKDIVTRRLPEAVDSRTPDEAAVTRPGDVLVSTVGKLAAMVDDTGGHLPGAGVVVLRVIGDQIDPGYLAAVLEGNWNKRSFTGQTIQRIAVQDLEVPVLTLEDQSAFAEAAADLRDIRRHAELLEREAEDALESLADVARFAGL